MLKAMRVILNLGMTHSERLLAVAVLSAFSPKHKTADGEAVSVSVSFKKPESWPAMVAEMQVI